MAPARAVAKVNGTVIAESDLYEKDEDNVYFPPAAVKYEYLTPSSTKTHCPWKGDAAYYNIEVQGVTIPDGAWCYHNPKDAFLNCRDFVTFHTYAPLMLVMRKVPLRFHKNKTDLSIGTIMESSAV